MPFSTKALSRVSFINVSDSASPSMMVRSIFCSSHHPRERRTCRKSADGVPCSLHVPLISAYPRMNPSEPGPTSPFSVQIKISSLYVFKLKNLITNVKTYSWTLKDVFLRVLVLIIDTTRFTSDLNGSAERLQCPEFLMFIKF